jgi:hypothetical protein
MTLTKNRPKTAKEKRQEREKEILGKEVSREQAIQELEGHIGRSKKAATALNELVEAGCNRKEVLWALYKFCGGSPAEADAVKHVFAARRDFLLRYSKRIKRVVSDLKIAESCLSDMELGAVFPQNLVEPILSLAEFLGNLANTVVKHYSWGRTSGRDHHLVHLAMMIEKATGRQHYKELADLVDAIRLGYDPMCQKAETADTIRNLVDRNKPLDLAFSSEAKRKRKPRISKQPTARKK